MKLVVTGTRGIPNIMGGVETHCEELFPRIASKGVDTTVIRRKNYIHDSLSEWKGVKLIDIDTPKIKSFEAIIHTFRAILKAKSLKADIIHIHAIGPALLTPFARLLGMKVVFTHHGPDYDREKWGIAAKFMLKLGERMGTKFANEVIVISNVINDILIKKYNRRDCHLIYNGVPEPEICDYPEYFDELGIEKGNYILAMCRFVPEKNLHHLVEAYNIIKNEKLGIKKQSSTPVNKELNCKDSEYHGIKLVLAGDTDFEDDYSRNLKKMAKDNGVILTGFIKGKKLHSLLSNAKCFVLPSSHEGLPIALLEAMSYRLPVLISNIKANHEIQLEDSFYFNVGDINTLSRQLNRIIENDIVRIDYNLSKYNWDYISNQVFNIYKKLYL